MMEKDRNLPNEIQKDIEFLEEIKQAVFDRCDTLVTQMINDWIYELKNLEIKIEK